MTDVVAVRNVVRPLRVAALIKQVPMFESFQLDAHGRLVREGLPLETNPHCRRAVAAAVELARQSGGDSTVVTLGPRAAEQSVREAVAAGVDHGVLVSDVQFAGSDTLATARALVAALCVLGPLDLILCGRNSVDADTGQLPAQLAELLDMPLLGSARAISVHGDRAQVRSERDGGFVTASATLPAVISCIERLCEVALVPPVARARVDSAKIRVMRAGDLGPGPWGGAASPTVVGRVEQRGEARAGRRLPGSVAEQVARAVTMLAERDALPHQAHASAEATVAASGFHGGPRIAAAVDGSRPRLARELLGGAAQLACAVRGHCVALCCGAMDASTLGDWGADIVVPVAGSALADDVAPAIAAWVREQTPWALLAPSTMWGREVAGRVAAATGNGLVGDAIDLDVSDGRLVAWKSAFGGGVVAAVTCTTPTQMATVRPGVLPLRAPRTSSPAVLAGISARAAPRVVLHTEEHSDDPDALSSADVVVAVGAGVPPGEYAALHPLLDVLGAELGATRKVVDSGWLPASRQIGITGRSVAPRLYVAVGISGRFNHMAGSRRAGTILAINSDPRAPVFAGADIGIHADWREAVPLLASALQSRVGAGR